MGQPPTRLGPMASWAYAAGGGVPAATLAAADLVVLDPYGEVDPRPLRGPGKTVLAWLSLGLVDESRPYHRLLAMAPGALAGDAPGLVGVKRVDPRSATWHTVLLGQVAPQIAAAGYDGLFLADLDVGPALEAAGGHEGAAAAMAEMVVDLHGLEPGLRLVAQGGLALLPAIGKKLDGLAAEGIFTEALAAPPWARPRPDADAAVLVEALRTARQATGLPIFVHERATAAEAPALAARARAAGFVPSVGLPRAPR